MANLQILLRQHVGAPCAPVVKAGDRVEKGTLIATPTGLGANIFSSAYGVVEDVLEDRIIIKPDEEQKDEYVKIPEGSKLDMVKAAGAAQRYVNIEGYMVGKKVLILGSGDIGAGLWLVCLLR